MDADAIVIGAGHNGLVAANLLADAGRDVVVLEAEPEPGGAVRSGETLEPGFVSDRFSAFHPLGYASPVLRRLDLHEHGLRWTRSPVALAHVRPGDPIAALLSTDLAETCAHLDADARGDGDAWRALHELWRTTGPALLDALMTPFPPVRAGARIARALGSRIEVTRFARFGLLPVRRLAQEHFRGTRAADLLAGCTLHTDAMLDAAGGGLFGWLLASLGQHVGWPVPVGGSGVLTAALVARLEARGGRVLTGTPATGIVVRAGRAAGVAVGDGVLRAPLVLAATSAPTLYRDLLPRDAVPAATREDLARFQPDHAVVKVDWTLDAPIPWTAVDARRAGTVHVADGLPGMAAHAEALAQGRAPERPFLLLGQYACVDPTRMPAGRDVAWAYTHVPAGADVEQATERMEAEIERSAPGFGALVRRRQAVGLPPGTVNRGSAELHAQLVFRPTPGLGRPETGVKGVYLASAAAHPGGGVQGGPGSNAARAALRAHPVRRRGSSR